MRNFPTTPMRRALGSAPPAMPGERGAGVRYRAGLPRRPALRGRERGAAPPRLAREAGISQGGRHSSHAYRLGATGEMRWQWSTFDTTIRAGT